MNHSLTTGTVPSDFKTAIVKSLLKKPSLDPNALTSHSPISSVLILSRILEKIVLLPLLAHTDTHNLLRVHQSAYREGHGTETALMSIGNHILCALDEDKISVLLLLALSTALYAIDHGILLSRPDFFSFLLLYPQNSPILVPFLSLRKETICNGSRQPLFYSTTGFRSTIGLCARFCSIHFVHYTTVTYYWKTLSQLIYCLQTTPKFASLFPKQIMTVWSSPFKNILQSLKTECLRTNFSKLTKKWRPSVSLKPHLALLTPFQTPSLWLLQHSVYTGGKGYWILACLWLSWPLVLARLLQLTPHGYPQIDHSAIANTSKLLCTSRLQITKNPALYTSVAQTPLAAHNSAH